MTEPMTLDVLEKYIRASDYVARPGDYDIERMVATVRAADAILERCEEKFHHSCFCRATRPLGEHGKDCKTKELIADIRRLRGGAK